MHALPSSSRSASSRWIPALCGLLAAGCGPVKPLADDTGTADSADSGDSAADTGDSDTGETADTAPVDRDSDGVPAGEDCDDTDPRISPDVAETWNGIDDDCDGVIDGDGTFGGDVTLRATAIYEGNPYRFTVSCPAVLHRAGGHLDVTATCTPDPTDDMAQLLLGPTLTLSATTESAEGAAWSGTGLIVSANGWDSNGAATLDWSGLDTVQAAFSLSAASLTLQADGTLDRG